MLRELLVREFALIEELRLEFDTGLNILTGETGAGKSIIIDALGLVLGGRFSSEMIRTSSDACYVEAVFDIHAKQELTDTLGGLGIQLQPGDALIVSREVSSSGKSRCRINGQTVNVGTLAEVGALLVDIHGQHDHQSLLSPDKQIHILDRFGGENLAGPCERVKLQYDRRVELHREFQGLQVDESEKTRRLELLGYQLQEIDDLKLQPGEEEELTREAEILGSAERLYEACAKSHFLLYEGDDGSSPAVAQLGEVQNRLEPLAAIDERLKPIIQMIAEAAAQAEEAARELRGYQDRIDFSPERLAQVQSRLEELAKVKRKYGGSIEAVLAHAEKARAEISGYTSREERLVELERELKELDSVLAADAASLSAKRRQVATALEDAITRELADLNMQKTRFLVSISNRPSSDGVEWQGQRLTVGPKGFDEVEFLVSPNPGEDPKPLARIASGGELSRIMLALKSILGMVDEIATMIFDEIDAGVGGRTAQAVGEKMLVISQYRQVLCITHLPQIASMAHRHFFIEKSVTGDRTVVSVRSLTFKERVEELARMLGGSEMTDLTLKHAQEMLTLAESVRVKKVGRSS